MLNALSRAGSGLLSSLGSATASSATRLAHAPLFFPPPGRPSPIPGLLKAFDTLTTQQVNARFSHAGPGADFWSRVRGTTDLVREVRKAASSKTEALPAVPQSQLAALRNSLLPLSKHLDPVKTAALGLNPLERSLLLQAAQAIGSTDAEKSLPMSVLSHAGSLGRALERVRVDQAQAFVEVAGPFIEAHKPLHRLFEDEKERMVQALVSVAAKALGIQRDDYSTCYLDAPEPTARGSVAYVVEPIEEPELYFFEATTAFGTLYTLGVVAQEVLHLAQGELARLAEDDDAMLATRQPGSGPPEHGPSISPTFKSLGDAFSRSMRSEPQPHGGNPLHYPLYMEEERDGWGFQAAVKIVACNTPAFRKERGPEAVYGDISLHELRRDGSASALARLAERKGDFLLADLAVRIGVREPADGAEASKAGEGFGGKSPFEALTTYLDTRLGSTREEPTNVLRLELRLQMLHAMMDVVLAAQSPQHPAHQGARWLVNAAVEAVGLPPPFPPAATSAA